MLKGVDYMKKIIPWMLATAVIMLVIPWLAVTFIKGDGRLAVFCSESYLCNLFRSIRWQGHKNILATTNYYSTILFAWDMAVL